MVGNYGGKLWWEIMVGNYGGKFSRADSRVSHLRSGDVEGVLFFGSTTGQSVRRAGILLAVGSDPFCHKNPAGLLFCAHFLPSGDPGRVPHTLQLGSCSGCIKRAILLDFGNAPHQLWR
jgi:hypothetical protein